MLKTDFLNGGCGSHLAFSIGLFSYFVSTKRPDAHHQVSIQLDYRGDVQIMNSWGSKFELAIKSSNVNVGPSL